MRYVFFLILLAAPLCAQNVAALNKTLRELQEKIGNGKHYSWSGEYQVAVRDSRGALQNITEDQMDVARAEGGKQLLHVKSVSGRVPEYFVVSNGNTTWSYMPDKKSYTEEESAVSDEQEAGPDASESFAARMLSELATIIHSAEALHSTVTETVKVGKEKQNWAVVDVIGKLDSAGNRKVVQIVMAPDKPVLHRLTYVEMKGNDATTISQRVQVIFNGFQVGEPLAADLFTFEVPKRAKLVEQLAIPGQPGSVMLNHTSPEIEARTLTGEKFRLSSMQGKVVLLNFWATWCPPCRAELPTIAKLNADFKDKGLVVYGVNDEDAKTARKYLEHAKLDIPTLDDSARKVHAAYRVTAIPTVFIIGRDGTVVKWLRGGHSEKSLREAIRAAGLAE